METTLRLLCFLLFLIEAKTLVNSQTTIEINGTIIRATQYDTNHKFQPKIIGGYPICLRNVDDTYCEVDRSYPEAAIDGYFQNSEFSDPLYLMTRDFEGTQIDIHLDNSSGFFMFSLLDKNDKSSTCAFHEKIIFPSVAKTLKYPEWVYVINNARYKQGIVTQTCTKDQTSRRYCNESAPTFEESKCSQRFKEVKLLAINPSSTSPYEDYFRFPAICECEINYDLTLKNKGN